ncbi:hypothetical protein ACVIW2_000334 [Bradyrhizobium huanghuaihaiense]
MIVISRPCTRISVSRADKFASRLVELVADPAELQPPKHGIEPINSSFG